MAVSGSHLLTQPPIPRTTESQGQLATDLSLSNMPCSQKILGIAGDGQLGRMLAEAASKLGVQVKVLGKQQSPAGAIAKCVDGDIKKPQDIASFATQVKVLIPEIKSVAVSGLTGSADQAPMYPAPKTIEIVQDKFGQKEFFVKAGIAVGEYCDIPDIEALKAATEKFGLPCMLKCKRDAYDGRGNYVLERLDDPNLDKVISNMGGYGKVYVEKWQSFKKELAVVVVRAKNGEVKTYPVTETIQRDNVCLVTETMAYITADELIRDTIANQLARDAVRALNGVGVFGVEMFLSNDDKILLNGVAPHVTNSGHFTLNGCFTSQYENNVRVAFGWPLGDTRLIVPHIIMYNILGEQGGPEGRRIADARIESALAIPGCHPYWYGKEVTAKRKVGHINIVGNSQDDARNKLKAIDQKVFELLAKNSPLIAQTSMGSRVVVSSTVNQDE